MSLRCSASYTRHSEFQCNTPAVYAVGVTGAASDLWRASCTQHLGKVVADRIAKISANGAVVVVSFDAANQITSKSASS